MPSNIERFIILDGHAILYRAFHAFPPELSTTEGQPINAVYGFTRILLAAVRDQAPDYIAVAFDHKDKTLRAEEYEEYKAQREPMPDTLKSQIPIVKDVVTALNIPQFELSGFEADDLIGTITKQLADEQEKKGERELLTIVITGDKDLFQLVDEYTHIWMPARGKFGRDTEYDAAGVLKKMQVTPEQIVDLKALMGDSSDNIPGVKGIGAKTAAALIERFGSLDTIYKKLDELETQNEDDDLIKGAVRKKLLAGRDAAYMSQKLATIDREVKLDFILEKCVVTDYDKGKVYELFETLGFKSLMELLPRDKFESEVQNALF